MKNVAKTLWRFSWGCLAMAGVFVFLMYLMYTIQMWHSDSCPAHIFCYGWWEEVDGYTTPLAAFACLAAIPFGAVAIAMDALARRRQAS